MNMNRYMWNRPGMQQGYNYGKRSADAEPTAVADADAYYRPYSYGSSQGYNWPMNSGYNMNNMNNNNMNMDMNNMNNMDYMNNMNMNRYMWNRPGMQQGYNYGKRSADAEPTAVAEADADAYYRPYSYGYSQGYNW